MSGRFGEPLVDSVPMTSPIYNPSVPYTVPESPEVRVSRQALDQFIANGIGTCISSAATRARRMSL
jgi:hypothetical protein